MAHSNYIVIVGCGRLGSMLANSLSVQGHSLVVIDQREIAFDKLSADFTGFKILGDASEIAVLREAKAHKADYLFATTTEDNINLMVAQIARTIFNVPNVVARVYCPTREAIYSEFGVQTISPTKLTADAFMALLHPELETVR
jgi:trk system potassium uptake protein TrkA